MDTMDTMDSVDEQLFADIAAYLETQQELLLPLALDTSSDGVYSDYGDARCEPVLPLGAIAADVSSESNALETLSQQQQHACALVQPSNQPATPASTPQPRVRNASRERMQRELKQLRVQSSELALQLAALRAHAAPHTSSSTSSSSLSSQQHERLLLAAWANAATRQLELRTLAELENARLKQQLQRHSALIDALQTALVHTHSAALAPPPPSVSLPAVHIRPEDVVLYRQLLSELDGAWMRMDRVLDDSPLGRLDRLHDARSLQSFSHASVRTQRGISMSPLTGAAPQYIELTSAGTMPFDHEAVFRANWECWERQSDAKGQVKLEHVPLRVNASVVELAITLHGTSIFMRILHVARAYREAHRISYVWRSVTSAATHFPGVVIDETGWQTMTTVATDDAQDTGASTEIRTCVHLATRATSDASASEAQESSSRLSPLTNLVISAVDAEELQVHDMMRRMLLEDAHTDAVRMEEARV